MNNNEKEKEILLFALTREDLLMHNRLSWVLTFQGLLFASASFLTNNMSVVLPINTMRFTYPILGVFVAIFGMGIQVWGAISIGQIRKRWGEIENKEAKSSPFGIGGHNQTGPTMPFGLSFCILFSCFIAWAVILLKICCTEVLENGAYKTLSLAFFGI